GELVLFRHPLVRAAAYHRASTEDRRAVHAALAGATDAERDPDRRAWHLALATDGPDEEVASELERSASRAQARGGMAAAGALLERAVALTPAPARRTTRALAAAGAHLEAGAAKSFHAMLAMAEAGPIDERARAQADVLRAYFEVVWGDTRLAPNLQLSAATRLHAIDARAARLTYHHALGTAAAALHLPRGTPLPDVARAIGAAPQPAEPRRPFDLVLDGLAMFTTDGPAAAAPVLRRALDTYRDEQPTLEEMRGLDQGAATVLWDL